MRALHMAPHLLYYKEIPHPKKSLFKITLIMNQAGQVKVRQTCTFAGFIHWSIESFF
jgi:hypothetical protein